MSLEQNVPTLALSGKIRGRGSVKRVQNVIKGRICMIQSCGEAPWVLLAPVHGKKYAANNAYVREHNPQVKDSLVTRAQSASHCPRVAQEPEKLGVYRATPALTTGGYKRFSRE